MTAAFGVRLPVGGPLAGVAAIEEVAHEAEQLGYDAVWVHDYIVYTRPQMTAHVSCGSLEVAEAHQGQEANMFEAITTLGYLAGRLPRMQLGVAVLGIPYRSPIVVAKQLATLDNLSGGRLLLGAGVGAPRRTLSQDFEVLGIPRRDKWAITRDYLKAMLALWSSPDMGYSGTHISFPPTQMDPKPLQQPHPPIWMGGSGDRSLSIAAELATGWLPGAIPPSELEARATELRRQAAVFRRESVELALGIEVFVRIESSQDVAQDRARRTLDLMANSAPRRASTLVGTPQQVAAKVAAYRRVGVGHFEMKFIYSSITDLIEQLKRFRHTVG
jgi:probable F420-dependent oxidoreductase